MRKIKQLYYHESSQASQYAKLGTGWYTNFVSAELQEIIKHPTGTYNPYGKGDDEQAPLIALGEAWGYHMGHFLADQIYGTSSSCAGEQNLCYGNNFIPGLSSHLVALEDFDPHLTTDPFHWIPKGLFYDLMDNRNDFLFNPAMVKDEVSGYTIQQIFNAYQSDIYYLQDYKVRLLLQNSNNQSVQVNQLFSEYGY